VRLRAAGGHYIAGMKMRAGMTETDAALSRPGRHRTSHGNLGVDEVKVGEGEVATRFVICHGPSEAQRARARRERRTGRAVIDRQKMAAEERLDGKYLLTTSDPSLSAQDVAIGYKQVLEAQRSFRDLKGFLARLPVFHRGDERIRAHAVICFLALVIIRVAETRTNESWRAIRSELGQIRQGHFRGPEGEFTQTTELTTRQRDLHAGIGVPEPPCSGRNAPASPGAG